MVVHVSQSYHGGQELFLSTAKVLLSVNTAPCIVVAQRIFAWCFVNLILKDAILLSLTESTEGSVVL